VTDGIRELYIPVVLDILATAQWDEEDSCRTADVGKEIEAVTLFPKKQVEGRSRQAWICCGRSWFRGVLCFREKCRSPGTGRNDFRGRVQ
jgi:hypothetical protein